MSLLITDHTPVPIRDHWAGTKVPQYLLRLAGKSTTSLPGIASAPSLVSSVSLVGLVRPANVNPTWPDYN